MSDDICNIKPTGEWVLVAPIKDKLPEHRSGIILPESVQEQYRRDQGLFYVIAVGPGKVDRNGNLIPVEVKPGDWVITHSYQDGPQGFEGDDKGLGRKFVKASMIICKITRDDLPDAPVT